MSTTWPNVRLGEVLKERRETPDAEALALGNMRVVSKIGFERGRIELRQELGTETGMILVRPGDLLLSGINAEKGAIAIYGADNKEPVAATIHYGAYITVPNRADTAYLWWYLRSNPFREILHQVLPEGIKTELKSTRLLPIEIPLPPVAEQRRMVARIEALAAKIAEARSLREQAAKAADVFIIGLHSKLAGKRVRMIGEIMRLSEVVVRIQPSCSYPQVGVKSFGAGLFAKPAVLGTDTQYKAFNTLYDGALVLSQVKGWEGAVAICPPNLAGYFVSPEYRTFACIEDEARSGYLAALVRTEWFWGRLAEATRGVGARRERTRPEQFLSIELPMPDVEMQRTGEEIFAKVDALRPLQAETAAKLNALLPSILDKAFKGEL